MPHFKATVVKGQGKGREIGFPTINLELRKAPLIKGVGGLKDHTKSPLDKSAEGFENPIKSPLDKGGWGIKRFISYNPKLTQFAKENRNNPTKPEAKIWYELLNRDHFKGLRFLRQKPINNFIIDFYCSKLLLAIKIDGDDHGDKEKCDNIRTKLLSEYGIKVLRYTNAEVLNNLEGIYQNLIEEVKVREVELNPPYPPLSRGLFSYGVYLCKVQLIANRLPARISTCPQPDTVFLAGNWTRRADGPLTAYFGAMHYGRRETMDLPESIEIHLLDYNGADMYGTEVEVEVLQKIRAVQKFCSIADLKKQIKKDIRICKNLSKNF